MKTYIVSEDYLTDIADAIRAKTGTIDTMTIDEMPQKITDISGANFDNVNVTAADVLAPKIFVDKDGNEQFGTMPTNNLITPSVSFDNGVFTSTVTQATGYVEESTTSNSLTIPDSWVELNFRVAGGTTQPTSPSENTIWVNTDTEISEWTFSAEDPYLQTQEIYTAEGMTEGYYLKSDGSTTSSSNFDLTAHIPLPTGTTSIRITASTTSTSSVCHVFYDANGTLVSSVLRRTGTVDYPVPAGAATVRVSIRTDDTASIIATCSTPPEGAVWIQTGLGGVLSFNALKKNAIKMYPLKTMQCVSGAWISKTAQSYQNGKWVGWALIIAPNPVDYGDGAWTKSGVTATITDNSAEFVITSRPNSTVYALIKVDVSNYTTLRIKGTITDRTTSSSGVTVRTGIFSNIPSYSNNQFVTGSSETDIRDGDSVTVDNEYDISAVEGEMYIGVSVTQGESSKTHTVTYPITKIELS